MLHIKIGLYFGLNKNRDLKMSKYYIKFGISANPNAGSKAMKDIMALLDSKGYKAVLALPTRTNKIIKLIWKFIFYFWIKEEVFRIMKVT